MTPDELDAFLVVAKRHGVTLLRVGDVVLGGPALGPVEAIAPGEPLPKMDPAGPRTPEEHWDAVAARLFPEDQA